MCPKVIRSRAPLRIGIAGGGTDVEPYASEKGGYVLNTTIDKYAYCTISPNDDKVISIKSLDYGTYEAPVDGGPLQYDGNMDLVKAVMNYFDIHTGFNVFLHSDAPPGSGLGGSSTVIVALLKAVTAYLGEDYDNYQLADLAYRLEREELKLAGGKQDQYAAAFGGFNTMIFDRDGVWVNPLGISEDSINELQYCSLLCYTGKSRESADIIKSQVRSFKERSNEAALDAAKELAGEIGKCLVKGNISEAGVLLGHTWEQKKKFSAKISNPLIDDMYNDAINAGAYGGKVSGAGGGGFMYFICRYDRKQAVAKALQKKGGVITDFMFEPQGAISWSVRHD